METTAGRILKSDDVKLEGQFHLEAMKTGSSLPPHTHQSGASVVEPQVRIAENHPEFAVIEITCSCGTTMQLRCEYDDVKTQDSPQNQNEK
jgi:hypothetical protein